MSTDPWPDIESLAAERQICLVPVRMLVEQVQSTLIIDPESAIGDTILDYLKAGRSLDGVLAMARERLAAALERSNTCGPEAVK